MAIVRAPFPRLQFKSDDGRLMSFCWLKVFIAGTNTQVRTYKNDSGSLNPIEIQLDYRGECDVWIDDDKKYRFELWSVDRKHLIKKYKDVSAGTGSVSSHTTDVIKWSDVQGSDYSELIDRIAEDIEAGIAPVLLDDVNDNGVVALYEFSDSVAAFRTNPDINGKYYNYVIRSDSATIQHHQITIPMRNSGTMSISTGLVYVKNNTVANYTYDGNNPLDFVFSGEANFEVTIKSTAAADGTVNVYKQHNNGLLTPMMLSVAGGNTVEAGKTYQLTCSNDGWTLAEFEPSVAVAKTIIGNKAYDAVKIGNLWWTVPNLDLTWTGLSVGDTSGWDGTDKPKAWYYDNMQVQAQSKQWGLLYNHEAVKHLVDNPSLLNGWRVPTKADWEALITAAGGSSAGTALRATTQWTNELTPATDAYGFAALPALKCTETSEGVTFADPATDESGYFRTATAQSDSTDWITIINGGNAVVGPMPSGNLDGYSLRLCRDAEA